MHEIHRSLLWMGHALDVRDARRLFEAGIAAVVDVAWEEAPAQLPRQLIYCRFPLHDGGGNDAATLLQALQTTTDLLGSGTCTLVACSAGVSRSPVISAFALAAHLGQPPEDVIERIAALKPLEVHASLWRDAAQAFAKVRRNEGGCGDEQRQSI